MSGRTRSASCLRNGMYRCDRVKPDRNASDLTKDNEFDRTRGVLSEEREGYQFIVLHSALSEAVRVSRMIHRPIGEMLIKLLVRNVSVSKKLIRLTS